MDCFGTYFTGDSCKCNPKIFQCATQWTTPWLVGTHEVNPKIFNVIYDTHGCGNTRANLIYYYYYCYCYCYCYYYYYY